MDFDEISHKGGRSIHKGGRSLSPWPPGDRSSLIHLKIPGRIRSQVQKYAIDLAWDSGYQRSPWPAAGLQGALARRFPVESPAPQLKQVKAAFPLSKVKVYQGGFLVEQDGEKVHLALYDRRKKVWGYTLVLIDL